MLKAAAGGGGKGMRLVHSRQELRSAFESAQSEAQRSFGDSEVYIEKAIVNPRHIEMQLLADEHGNTVWLGERECSIQRRHQKVLEEAPSPIVDPEMRRRMGEVAVKAAQAADYTNAGTIEFLGRSAKEFLLSGNEHAPAGRTSGHRVDDRTRSGAPADSHRRRRESCPSRSPTFRFADMPSSAASTPKIRTTIIFPAPAKSQCCSSPPDREFAATAACMKAGMFPWITIRCSPS